MSQEITRRKPDEAEVSDCVVNLRRIRKQMLPYMFVWIVYYAWMGAFSTWWTASPLTEHVFSAHLRGLMHSVALISSALFIFVIRKEWFVKTARIGAILIVSGMIAFFAASNTSAQMAAAVIGSIAMGLINISILMPFVFLLNNTEKLYAVVGSNTLIQLISLFLEWIPRSGAERILSFAILMIALGTMALFQSHALASNELQPNPPVFRRRIYLTILFNCLIGILCKGAGKGVLNVTAVSSGMPILMWYYVGGLIGCASFVAVYAVSKKAYVWLGNITFAGVAMGLFCNAFSVYIPGFAAAFAVLLGIGATVGMINMYYIVGVVGKKYNSMRYLRLSILLIGICGGVSGLLVGNLISSIGTFEVSMAASVISAAVMMVFMMVSPIVAQTQFENDWAKDSQQSEIDNERIYMFLKYKLSRREIEVCRLLLQGYTMRQISGILSIAYPTVNTYCTSIYRKTNINSRTELMQVFKDYTDP